MGRTGVLAVVLTTLALGALLVPGRAWAPVPPRDCGMVQAAGNRFNVKADQIRCRAARRYAKAYLVDSREPSGYNCRNYGRETRIEFRCSRGAKVLFAIRR